MKKIKFLIIMIFISLFLPSCIIGGGGDQIGVHPSETDLNAGKTDTNRESISGRCESYKRCEKVCEEVYDEDEDEENEGKVEACVALRYNVAIHFEHIFEVLDDRDKLNHSNLKNIAEEQSNIFREFLNVSVAPWVNKVRRVGSSEAKDLLIWIARYKRISEAIYDSYKKNLEKEFDRYEGVNSLFSEIGGCTNNITQGQTYINIATENNNCDAIKIYNQTRDCSPVSLPTNC